MQGNRDEVERGLYKTVFGSETFNNPASTIRSTLEEVATHIRERYVPKVKVKEIVEEMKSGIEHMEDDSQWFCDNKCIDPMTEIVNKLTALLGENPDPTDPDKIKETFDKR